MEQLKMKSLFEGRVQFVPVKLRREWMGNPKGAEMTITRRQAEILESRGTAKILVESDDGDKERPIRKKRRKSMDSPPRDKQVKGAEKTK